MASWWKLLRQQLWNFINVIISVWPAPFATVQAKDSKGCERQIEENKGVDPQPHPAPGTLHPLHPLANNNAQLALAHLATWLVVTFAQCAIPKVFYPYICTYVFATFDINIFWFYNFKFSRKGSLIYRTLMVTINAKLYIKPKRKCVSTSDFNNIFENDGKHKGGGKLRWRQMLAEPKTKKIEG